MIDPKTHTLIREIYETVADQKRWPEVLTHFADLVGARGCIVSEIEVIGDTRQIVTPYICTRYDAKLIDAYLDAFIDYELQDQARYERLSDQQDQIDLIDQRTLLQDDLDAYLAQPNVRRMREFGVRERAGGLLDKDNKLRARFSMHFGEESPPLTDAHRRRIRQLLDHIAKAIELGQATRRLDSAHRHLLEAIDRLRMGVCVLDRFGRVEAANVEFRRQVEAYPAYSIDANNRLQISDLANRKRLSDLLSDPLQHGRMGARPHKEAIIFGEHRDCADLYNTGALCLEVAPLHRLEDIGSKDFDGAIIFSLDTTRPMPFDATLLQERFKLSKSELDVLNHVAEGLSNADIAERRGRAVNTINSQIRMLIGKTGAMNRTHLVRLMGCFGTDYLTSAPTPAAPTSDRKQH